MPACNPATAAAAPGIDWQWQAAEPGDLQAMAGLRVAAMRASLERIGRFDLERARARLREGFDAACARHIVLAGQRVGLALVRPVAAADGVAAHWRLDHLYLLPAAQGQGLGSAVLRALLAEADQAGQALHLGALRDSDANRFYLRHGFVLVGRSEFDNHYRRPPRG
ncbi:GNAT family N-acetyltransferase [Aquabacterium sp. OR-4]|uniref:GNAT family N-acetyltransferase n=1 Tax=Aquabacterium sp. OR-4 TaxID=2978127 RepID=UPI0021B4D240|nr:GNAT family N-acetyltransferase [Aquabacterium sp. OR-4]MDT7836757.1 GNAT family N-acetyltransferase [Aquabacterium sp. OR-4]